MANNKVGIYTRVSSDTQVIEGHSLEWQEVELKKYAEIHNLNVVDVYVEKGISGESIEKRPQLKRLFNDIEEKRINHVLVYKIDRLGRQVLTNAIICKILVDNHCSLTASDCGVIELEKAYGSLMYNTISAISQFEVDNLSERIINGKKQRTRNGLYINSNNVYGYDNYYDKYKGVRLLTVNDFESQVIKDIYSSYLNGISMNNIAEELNHKQIPCKRGGKWGQSTINQILTNKLYIGIVTYRGNAKKDIFENKGVHEAIIDENVFYKVQDLIDSRKKKGTKKILSEYSYFASVLECKEDNSGFKPRQTKAKDKTSVRYYCKNKACEFPSIKHIELEEIFINKLKRIKLDFCENTIKEIFSNSDYEIILKVLNKLKKEQNELFDYKMNGIIGEDDFKERMGVIKAKKQALLVQQEKLKNKIVDYNDTTKQQVYELLDNGLMINFQQLTPKDKESFVNLFVEKIIIDKYHDIRIKWKRQ